MYKYKIINTHHKDVILYSNCRISTTNNVILIGLQDVDGVSLQEGDSVLVCNQNNPYENDVYKVCKNNWKPEFNLSKISECLKGLCVYVEEGILNTDSIYIFNSGSKTFSYLCKQQELINDIKEVHDRSEKEMKEKIESGYYAKTVPVEPVKDFRGTVPNECMSSYIRGFTKLEAIDIKDILPKK